MSSKVTSKRNEKSIFEHLKFEYFAAGVSGGTISTAILHPLDLLKIRLAVTDGITKVRPQYSGLTNAVLTIVKQEGFRGFYRGVTPNVWGAGSSWGLCFLFYNSMKSWMQDYSDDPSKNLTPLKHMSAGAVAGALTMLMVNPVWVVKTRLCLQNANLAAIPSSQQYNGMIDGLVKLYKHEGIAGMYRGLVPGLFGTLHGALQFMAYEELKVKYLNYKNLPADTKLGASQYIAFAALSKLFAVSSTYPYQVIRTRLQDQIHNYHGMIDIIKRIMRYEGARGFYKGLLPNLLRMTPATAITFVVYEKVSRFLLDLRS